MILLMGSPVWGVVSLRSMCSPEVGTIAAPHKAQRASSIAGGSWSSRVEPQSSASLPLPCVSYEDSH